MQGTDAPVRTIVLEYIKRQYHAEPEYLWARYPDYAVFRHKENCKWFAVIMDVPKRKIGLLGEDIVWILNVKVADKLFHDTLARQDGFLPGYHMNKAAWISILLDGTVPAETVFQLIDDSFDATGKTKGSVKG